MNLYSVVGARPQFLKAAMIADAVRVFNQHSPTRKITHSIIHTGQHYDINMSDVFFRELALPEPAYNLNLGGLNDAETVGRVIEAVSKIIDSDKPDATIVYGDTNSTLGASLAGVKSNVPVIHVEAGVRCFDRKRPEEVNRVLTDQVAAIKFCPSEMAYSNLVKEGLGDGAFNVGDVTYEAFLRHDHYAGSTELLNSIGVEKNNYALLTIHRQENVDDAEVFRGLCKALNSIASETPLVWPIHPRAEKRLEQFSGLDWIDRIHIIPPVSYRDMLTLEANSKLVITDSGGVQKEAFFWRKNCIIVSDYTEWPELVDSGWATLTGTTSDEVMSAWNRMKVSEVGEDISPYGAGKSAAAMIDKIMELI